VPSRGLASDARPLGTLTAAWWMRDDREADVQRHEDLGLLGLGCPHQQGRARTVLKPPSDLPRPEVLSDGQLVLTVPSVEWAKDSTLQMKGQSPDHGAQNGRIDTMEMLSPPGDSGRSNRSCVEPSSRT
jgi:hypothetical protein